MMKIYNITTQQKNANTTLQKIRRHSSAEYLLTPTYN